MHPTATANFNGSVTLSDPDTGQSVTVQNRRARYIADGLCDRGMAGEVSLLHPVGINRVLSPADALAFAADLFSAACEAALVGALPPVQLADEADVPAVVVRVAE